jgi:hypothetical protein
MEVVPIPGTSWLRLYDEESAVYYHPMTKQISISVPTELSAELQCRVANVLSAHVGPTYQVPAVKMHFGDWLVLGDTQREYFYYIPFSCLCDPPLELVEFYRHQLKRKAKDRPSECGKMLLDPTRGFQSAPPFGPPAQQPQRGKAPPRQKLPHRQRYGACPQGQMHHGRQKQHKQLEKQTTCAKQLQQLYISCSPDDSRGTTWQDHQRHSVSCNLDDPWSSLPLRA